MTDTPRPAGAPPPDPPACRRDLPPLTPRDLVRYARHLRLPQVGVEGQRRLKASRVLCVGAGGLGSASLLYLAAAGVGRITVIDPDRVEESNLQRQVLFGTSDTGRSKAEVAAARLAELNPGVDVVPLVDRLVAANARRLVAAHDVVVDGTDSFAARYLVNDAAVLERRPNVHAAVHRFEGRLTVLGAPGGPCYRCLHPEPPTDDLVDPCASVGILGATAGVLGVLQASECLKLLLGTGGTLAGRLLLVDLLAATFRTVRLARDPACPSCGESPTLRELSDAPRGCGAKAPGLTAEELRERLGGEGRPVLVDVRDPDEVALAAPPGTLSIPYPRLAFALESLGRDEEIVLLCETGHRSSLAAAWLRARGFTKARSLDGGLAALSGTGGAATS